MALIVFLLFCIFLYICIVYYKRKLLISLAYTFVLVCAVIFLSANVLSEFELWKKIPLMIMYSLASLILGYFIVKNKMYQPCFIRLTKNVSAAKNADRFVYVYAFIIFIGIMGVIVRATAYPPQNTDSLTYHLPRAFYYYKMGKIDNFPAPLIITNYSAPGNAVFMSHFFILLDGSDRLSNLYQLPSVICIVICSFYICRGLGVSKRISQLAVLLVFAVPLVMLQAVTTQNDLFVSGFALMAVCFILQIVNGNENFFEYLCAGICIGAAVNTKINSGIILLPVLLVFIVTQFRKKNLGVYKHLLIMGLAAFLIVLPFWYRNFADLNGNFLAIESELILEGDGRPGFADYIGRVVLNLGYCLCGRIQLFNVFYLSFLRKVYDFLGACECTDYSRFHVYGIANHDYTPYGLLLFLTLICSLYVVFSKGYSKLQKTYAAVSILSIVLVAAELPTGALFMPSITRYILPAVLLNLLVTGLVLEHMKHKNRNVCKLAAGGIIICAALNIAVVNVYDTKQSVIHINRMPYEMKRDYTFGETSWVSMKWEFKEVIDSRGFHNIGIYEEQSAAIYPMLHVLASDKYCVRSVYGEYGMDYDDKNFNPEVLIYTGNRKILPASLFYHNCEYKLFRTGESIPFDAGIASLYIHKDYY